MITTTYLAQMLEQLQSSEIPNFLSELVKQIGEMIAEHGEAVVPFTALVFKGERLTNRLLEKLNSEQYKYSIRQRKIYVTY